MYVSPETQGFYDPEINSEIPSDAIELSAEQYQQLLLGRQSGKVVAVNSNGALILSEPLISDDELASTERAWRDGRISSMEWLVNRNREQKELDADTTLTPAQFIELLTYRKELRDWPEAKSFPAESGRPVAPSWLDTAI